MPQTAPAKKMLIMNILDILKRYTDEEHRLTQKQIADILWTDYDMAADRKTIARNLTNLMAAGYPIECRDNIARTYINKQGQAETSYMLSDFYLERDFTDAELRLLIDSLLFSKHIPYSQCRELVEKLAGLSNRYFKSRVRFISTMEETAPSNPQLFYTIEIIDEAIAAGRQVAFIYNAYGTDKRLHPKRDQEYIVNPYQIAATNGRYYLIGNYDKYDNLANYRMDRITDIRLLDTPAKPTSQVKGLEHGFDLPKHMAEHLYMFTGESGVVTFRAKRYLLNDIMDWFGGEITFFDETEEEVSVRTRVNLAAMRRWALQYALHARVLSPESLVQQVKEDIKAAADHYNL